jgi:predicted dehydrogenase
MAVRAAIVGLGWWGRHIVDCLHESGSTLELVRGVDASTARLVELAPALLFPLTASLEDALEDSSVDAVILATAHSLHEAQIIRCANAGKHVFAEKPLTLTRAGALRAQSACDSAGVVLGVGHERRFEPAFAEIKKLIDAQALGTLMHIEANFSHDLLASVDRNDWRASVDESPIPALSAMAIHLTDALLFLCGPIEEVFAYATQRRAGWGSGDVLSLQLKFASGLTASLSTILMTPMYVRFQVFGSEAWVESRSDVHPGQPGITHLTVARSGTAPAVTSLSYLDTVRVNLEAFAGAVAGDAPYPISPEEKVGNISVMEAVVRSARTGAAAKVITS